MPALKTELFSTVCDPVALRARREVVNSFAGLRYVEKNAAKSHLAHDDMLALHRIIAAEVMDQGTAGGYRTIHVRVGRYTPPPPEDVSGLMFELLTWWNKESTKLSPIVSSAIIHYRFEAIHPFADGNGRTGRALTLWELYRRGFDTHHIFSVRPVTHALAATSSDGAQARRCRRCSMQALELQRWTQNLHAVVCPKLLHHDFLVRQDFLSKPGHPLEKILHAPGRLKQHEHLPFAITGLGERVRYLARRKRGIAWMQAQHILAHSHHKLTPDHIKPFVLKMVAVKRRTTLRFSEGIINAQVATGVAARDLQLKAPAHDQQLFLIAILLLSHPEPCARALAGRLRLGGSRHHG